MSNVATFYTENNELVRVEVLVQFRVNETGKDYVAYSLNDDGVSENVTVCISEFKIDGNVPKILPIKEEEAETVLMVYNSISFNK